MPTSKQQPLTAQGTHEHDFMQSYESWEAAVFDRAVYFAVYELRWGERGDPPRHTKWKCFPWAVRYAKESKHGPCIYAVVESGRFNNLDREKWDEWVSRWK